MPGKASRSSIDLDDPLRPRPPVPRPASIDRPEAGAVPPGILAEPRGADEDAFGLPALPAFLDAPNELRVYALEDANDGEIHGIGEQCLPPAAPAVASAIASAVGMRVTELPVSPERVLKGLSRPGAGNGTG